MASTSRLVLAAHTYAGAWFATRTLLQAMNCDYDTNAQPFMRVDPRIVCWEGEHVHLVVIAVFGVIFLLCTAILVVPRIYNAMQGTKLQLRGGNAASFAGLTVCLLYTSPSPRD